MDANFVLLGAVMRLYEHNAKILHWCAAGRKFDRIHGLCDEFEKLFHDGVDFAAETGLRIGQIPVPFNEIYTTLKEGDGEFIICSYDENYGYDRTIAAFQHMFADVMQIIMDIHDSEEMGESINMGIKSELEGLFNSFDFQARYLNKHRLPNDAEKEHSHH